MKILGMTLPLVLLSSCGRKQPENVHWIGDSYSIAAAIKMYRQITGEIPTNEQGLDALSERPENLASDKPWRRLIEKPFSDAWGNPYRYQIITDTVPTQFEIRSYGADGIIS